MFNAPIPTVWFDSYRGKHEAASDEEAHAILRMADGYVMLIQAGAKWNPSRRIDVSIDIPENMLKLSFHYVFTPEVAFEVCNDYSFLSHIAAVDIMERQRHIRAVVERFVTFGEKTLAEKSGNVQ